MAHWAGPRVGRCCFPSSGRWLLCCFPQCTVGGMSLLIVGVPLCPFCSWVVQASLKTQKQLKRERYFPKRKYAVEA